MTSGEKGVTTTILCAYNSVGHYVPPITIFKRKKKKLLLTDNAPVGTIQGCSENGWVNADLFFEYIQHFVKHVRCTLINKVLLIFDGHRSRTKIFKLIETKPIVSSSPDNSKLCGKYCLMLATHNCSSSIAVTNLIFLAISLGSIQAEQVASGILKKKMNADCISKGATFSLSTGGNPLVVTVGCPANKIN